MRAKAVVIVVLILIFGVLYMCSRQTRETDDIISEADAQALVGHLSKDLSFIHGETYKTGMNDSFHLMEWSFQTEKIDDIKLALIAMGLSKQEKDSVMNFSSEVSKTWISNLFYDECDVEYGYVDSSRELYKSVWLDISERKLVIEIGNW